jgi:hypothetical protein
MPGMPPADMANVDINQAAQGAMQQGLDPAVLEGMLGDYSQQMEDLDNAEDYETVINGIRGDQLPMEARYAELAGVVGQEDARSTPESVLTLVQPVMQLAAVDQGIGGLAQDEMSTPIEGPMAEGIMSTVNMGAPEGPASVNFNQGGAVQYMEPGGVVSPLQQAFNDREFSYNSIIGPQAYDQADLDAERNMTQAQMLFDVAGTALAFATPGERQMSPAQRLAQAATDTQLFEKIGARAKDQMTTDRGRKKDMRDEKMQIDLMRLKSAEDEVLQDARARAASAASGVQNFFNDQGKIITTLKGSPEYYNAIHRGFTSTGPVSQTAADKAQGVNFQNQTTNQIVTFVQGSPEALAAIDDPNMVLTGMASQEGQDTPLNFMSTIDGTIKTVIKGSPEARKLIEDENWTYTGAASQSAADKAQGVNFQNQTTNQIVTFVQGSPEALAAIDDPNMVLTGMASQTPASTARETLYNATTGETLNPLASDPNIDALLKDGYEIVTTPPRPTTPKLSARTLFITDNERINAYANGTLDPTQTARFEQIIGEMQIPTKTTVDGVTTVVGAKPLSKPLVDAIRNRLKNGHATTDFGIPAEPPPIETALQKISNMTNKDGTGNTAAQITALQDYRNNNTGTLKRRFLDSPMFKQTLLNESGVVDLTSEAWRMVPTQIYKAGVNYDMARGLSTIPDRVSAYFGEIGRDLFGGRVSQEGLMIYQADNDFKALKTLTMGTIADAVTDDRVLKIVQDQIMATLDPLVPGVLKFDAHAAAGINTVAGILASTLDEKVAILPEYGGNPSFYSDQEIREARRGATKLRGLLAEYVQFGDQMAMFLSGEQGVGGRAGDATIQQNQNVLYKEAVRQQGAGN